MNEPDLLSFFVNIAKFVKDQTLEMKVIEAEEIEVLFGGALEGIIIVNESGKIERVNPSASKLFGYTIEELPDKEIEILIPQWYAIQHQKHRESFKEIPPVRMRGSGINLVARQKDGTEFPVDVSLIPFSTSQGKFTVAFIEDITVKRQADEKKRNYSEELEKQVKNRTMILEEAIMELEKTKLELKRSLDKEKKLNELKSRFVSMASYEFRTPLATIMSSLTLVKKYGEQNQIANRDKHIAKIKSAINNLTDILNDFLSVSKFEEGKITNRIEEFSIQDFIASIIADIQGIAEEKQSFSYKHKGNETVALDPKLLRNIMFNLLSNAMKFSPDDGIIEIASSVTKSIINISVKDQGIGISKEDQKHLFERFFRGHNAIHVQGTGLGLNIIANYVELMNGTIEVESVINSGTTLTLIFQTNNS